LAALGRHGPTTPEALLATAYMVVVGSVLAFVLYFTLLRHWSAAKASYASLLASAGAMALGLLLGEPATPRVLLGGGLILLGAAACLAKGLPWKRRPAHKEAPA
jgi:drug/metabolite transporter (DMT)-like permease